MCLNILCDNETEHLMLKKAIIYWIRRDFRLSSNLVLQKSIEQNIPLIPVFIYDDIIASLGSCSKWRLSLGLESFDQSLKSLGSKIVFRKGNALTVLLALAKETKASEIWWNRLYDPTNFQRDQIVMSGLDQARITYQTFIGHLLFEPNQAQTSSGGFFKVYTPFWKNVKNQDVPKPFSPPTELPQNTIWPKSEHLDDWNMGKNMQHSAPILEKYTSIGESAAQNRLKEFVEHSMSDYKKYRDFPRHHVTSKLSPFLTYGEISPWDCWYAAQKYGWDQNLGAETFAKELVWREFGYHLAWHTPHIMNQNWRESWNHFPWCSDESDRVVTAWQRGLTGIEIVDAGMRELYTTGLMHNRVRMIVASFLTKHLLKHWKIGLQWFEEHLIDWDPASNALGWQWVAGCGPDAAPYFRVFNPLLQRERFDKNGYYCHQWIAEINHQPPPQALDYFRAIPKSWKLSPSGDYPMPIIDLSIGRHKALEAYQQWKNQIS